MFEWSDLLLIGAGAIVSYIGTIISKVVDYFFLKKNFQAKKTEIFTNKQLSAIESVVQEFNEIFILFGEIYQEFTNGSGSVINIIMPESRNIENLYNNVIKVSNVNLMYINSINNGDQFEITRNKMKDLFDYIESNLNDSDFITVYDEKLADFNIELDKYNKEITAYYELK